MSLSRCTRCEGFVPHGASSCPNCRSTRRAWWKAPLALVGAGLATVTLSACYGPACTVPLRVTLPDGTQKDTHAPYGLECGGTFDCRAALPDGGDVRKDYQWKGLCEQGNWEEELDGGNKDGG